MKKRLLVLMVVVLMVAFTMFGCAQPAAETSSSPSAAGDASADASAASQESSAASGAAAADSIYGAPSTLYKEGGGNKIGITVIDNTIPHCQAFVNGASEVIKANGDIPVVLDPGFDAAVQANNIDDFVAQGCVGIVCETIDGQALISVTQNAVNQGVMVVSADFPFAEGYENLICSQVMTPNEEAGAALAEKMAEDLNYEGKIVILANPGTGPQARADGFRSVIEKYEGLELVYDGDGGGEVEKANSVMQDQFQANTDISAVICSNDEQAIGAHTAAETAGIADQVKCYGFDGAPEALDFVKQGKETASLGQQPYAMAKQSALDLYKAMKGEPVGDAVKYTTYKIITSENADEAAEYYYEGDPNIKYVE